MDFWGIVLEFIFDLVSIKLFGRRCFPCLYKLCVLLALLAMIGYFLFWGIVKMYSAATNPYRKKLKEIEVALSSYKQFHSKYPASLKDLTGSDPNRSSWEWDYWGTNVRYKVSDDLQTFTFSSAGKDKVFNTDDDIIISN
ncbi:MAG TPA: hypothetical protein VIK89_10065 [Cytophagaceae bacterium]